MQSINVYLAILGVLSSSSLPDDTIPNSTQPVTIRILEGPMKENNWDLSRMKPTDHYQEAALGLVALPQKYNAKGLRADRTNPFVIEASMKSRLYSGGHEGKPGARDVKVLLRAKGAARLWVDGKLVLETNFLNPNASGHEEVPQIGPPPEPGALPMIAGQQERMTTFQSDGREHEFKLEVIVGGPKLRPEIGEALVAALSPGEHFQVLGANLPLREEEWNRYARSARMRIARLDAANRKRLAAGEDEFWSKRHEYARTELALGQPIVIPEKRGPEASAHPIDRFLAKDLAAASLAPAPVVSDWAFLRRATLDLAGTIPSRTEIKAYFDDPAAERRLRLIDRLLADNRWADSWMGYWQDVLAENPGILKPTLNNTGPFRWWLYEALLDNRPMDRFVTELVSLAGSKCGGGPAGFGLATENDVPLAAKAHIVAKAFLAAELQCARCHDAPYHPYKQADLFGLAALLARKPQTVPASSTIPKGERTRRALVEVTLEPGAAVEPNWNLKSIAPGEIDPRFLQNAKDDRERFAALITSPKNSRFAKVMVNRVWKRFLGRGLVEPVDDWNGATASHPELLEFLAREFVYQGYDLKAITRLIVTSEAYARTVVSGKAERDGGAPPLFQGPTRRRLLAEQIVDSLYVAAGKEFDAEELSFDPEGRRPPTEMLTLGIPSRAWQMTSLSNERDRPALALPMAQGIADLLVEFGWRESRQFPLTDREEQPTPLQPLVLSNGVAGARVVRVSDNGQFVDLALAAETPAQLVDELFQVILTRPALREEVELLTPILADGFAERAVPGARPAPPLSKRGTAVSWSNHLSAEATRIKLELERRAREGDPPTSRLTARWRERYEDVLWAIFNSPEFLFVP